MVHKEYNNQINSRINWVGNIPSHWGKSKFKHEFVFSKSTNTSKKPTILSLTLQGIKIRDISTNEGQIASSYDNYTKVYKGDIVLNPMDLISGFVDCSPVEGVISPAYYTLKPNKDINPEYYKYYLQKHYYEKIFFPFAEGVSVDHRWTLKKEDFLNFSLIKPPIEEQKQISNYLDKQTAKIDATIAKNKELIDLLEEKRVALINQVVTKGLNPDVPMKDSGVEWIGEIPEHWDIINLKRFSNKITQGPNPDLSIFSDEKKYKILKTKDITDKEIKYETTDYIPSESYLPFSNFKLINNDILVCIVGHGSIGKINIFREQDKEFIFTRAIGLLRPDISIIEPYFVKYFFESKVGKELINSIIEGSTGQEVVKTSKLGSLNIAYPNLNEQRSIVSYLNNEICRIYKTIDKITLNINLLEEYKTSIIHHAITGKIDVREEVI